MRIYSHLAFVMACAAGLNLRSQSLQWAQQISCTEPGTWTKGMHLIFGSADDLYGAGTVGEGSVLAGSGQVPVNGRYDALLTRVNRNTGEIIWSRTIGGPCAAQFGDTDAATSLYFDPQSEHVLLAGTYTGTATFGGVEYPGSCEVMNYGFLTAYDDAGNEQWGRVILGENIHISEILRSSDGIYHVLGNAAEWDAFFAFDPVFSTPMGGFHATYGADGDFITAERILRHGQAIKCMSTNIGYLLSGYYTQPDTLWGVPLEITGQTSAGFVARIADFGDVDWVAKVTSSVYVSFANIAELSNGQFIGQGVFTNQACFPNDTLVADGNANFLACYSPSGELQWLRNITSSGFLIGFGSLVADPDNGFYLSGTFAQDLAINSQQIQSTTSRDKIVLHFDSLGNVLAGIRMGRVKLGFGGDLLVSEEGVYTGFDFDSTMVIGAETFLPTVQDYPDLFVAKFDSLPAINSINSLFLGNTDLLIYANPNTGTCTVELPGSISPGSEVQLRIIDNMGRLVDAVPLRMDLQGRVEVDIRAQARGLYHLELLSGSRRYTGKIVFE